MTQPDAAKWHEIGRAAAARGDVDTAEDAIGRAVLEEPGLTDTADVLFEDAKRLLADGKHDDAETSFRRLLSFDSHRAEGNYGLGYLRLRRGQADAARALFERAIEDDPQHANAAYQLGFMAEQRGVVAEARSRYAQALASNPAHRGSQERLAALSPPGATVQPAMLERVDTPAPVAPPPPRPPTSSPYGVYEYLVADQSPLSRDTITSMDALHTSTHPRVTAYVGRHLVTLVLLLAAPLVLFNALVAADLPDELAAQLGTEFAGSTTDTVRGLQYVVVLALFLVLAFCYARIKTTRFTITRGRLQIHKGIVARHVSNIELWRVQSVELDRTFVNRLTGDGTLTIELTGSATSTGGRRARRRAAAGKIVKVTGLNRGQQLDETYQQLLNLVFLLRANPVVKGIIQ